MSNNSCKRLSCDVKMQAKKMFFILRYGLLILGICSFLFFALINDLNAMFISILIIFLSNLCFALEAFSKRMAYTLFLLSFFCFLLGRMAMNFFETGKVNFYFSESVSMYMLVSIALSLVFLQFGFELFEKMRIREMKKQRFQQDSSSHINYCIRLQNYSRILFLFSSILAILVNIEQIYYVAKHGYLDLFTSFSSQIPRIFHIIGNMYIATFLLFLATRPKKKTCILPITIFLLTTISILLIGDRGIFVINCGVIVVYLFWRQYLDKEVWIPNKIIVIGILCIPLILAGMSFFVYLREGVDVGEKDVLAQIIRFFKASGNTVDILGYGKEYKPQFPQSFYSFGELIDYVIYNPISEKVLGVVKPTMHTEEYAMTMHSYAHTISYFIFPDQYLLGHGKGSCYIAEAFHDFGYLGIIICNFIYGVFMAGIYKLNNAKPLTIAIAFISLRILFYVPRGPMISPVSYVLNFTTLAALLFLHFAAKFQPTIIKLIKKILPSRS